MEMIPGHRVRFGIAVPQVFVDRSVDMGLVKTFLQRAELLGYHSAWVQEQILGDAPSLEPVVLLAYAAACTCKLLLGAAVLLLPLRNPVQLAKSLSALDYLSGGRLIVGVGLGGDVKDYSAFGLTPEGRVHRFCEAMALMRKLWTEPSISFNGEFFTARGVHMEPKPLQGARLRVWMGGHHPTALRRAVQLGDGWIGAGASSIEQFRAEVRMVREALAEARRAPDSFEIAKRVYVALNLGRSTAETEKRLSDWFAAYYGDPLLARTVAVYGDDRECADQIQQIVAAGATLPILTPVFDELDQLDALTARVVSQWG